MIHISVHIGETTGSLQIALRVGFMSVYAQKTTDRFDPAAEGHFCRERKQNLCFTWKKMLCIIKRTEWKRPRPECLRENGSADEAAGVQGAENERK